MMRIIALLLVCAFAFGCQAQEAREAEISIAKAIAYHENLQYENLLILASDPEIAKKHQQLLITLLSKGRKLRNSTIMLYLTMTGQFEALRNPQ